MAQGLELFQQGKAEQAVFPWREAARLYAQAHRPVAQSIALMRLAEAYQALGQYTQAVPHLHTALQLIEQDPDQTRGAAILASLGNVYSVTGPADEAERLLTSGIATRTRAAQCPPDREHSKQPGQCPEYPGATAMA